MDWYLCRNWKYFKILWLSCEERSTISLQEEASWRLAPPPRGRPRSHTPGKIVTLRICILWKMKIEKSVHKTLSHCWPHLRFSPFWKVTSVQSTTHFGCIASLPYIKRNVFCKKKTLERSLLHKYDLCSHPSSASFALRIQLKIQRIFGHTTRCARNTFPSLIPEPKV